MAQRSTLRQANLESQCLPRRIVSSVCLERQERSRGASSRGMTIDETGSVDQMVFGVWISQHESPGLEATGHRSGGTTGRNTGIMSDC